MPFARLQFLVVQVNFPLYNSSLKSQNLIASLINARHKYWQSISEMKKHYTIHQSHTVSENCV